jgi:hypothetical protein
MLPYDRYTCVVAFLLSVVCRRKKVNRFIVDTLPKKTPPARSGGRECNV